MIPLRLIFSAAEIIIIVSSQMYINFRSLEQRGASFCVSFLSLVLCAAVLFVLLPQIVGAIWPNRPAYCLLVLCHPGATATLFESLTNHSFFRNFCWKTLTTFVICSGWALWWMGKITLKMQLKQFDPDTYLLPLIFCYPGPSVARKLKQIFNSRFVFKEGIFHFLMVFLYLFITLFCFI